MKLSFWYLKDSVSKPMNPGGGQPPPGRDTRLHFLWDFFTRYYARGITLQAGCHPLFLSPLAKPDYPFARLIPLKPGVPFKATHRLYRLDVEIPYESDVMRTCFDKAFMGGYHTLLKVEPAATAAQE
ncbi:hypothetical protein [Arcticibacter sp. MXS-1]|uniref:hypothetical protein n=1 Tax=Arcticibacter sp. MXS-1 TaxID=3341726 RepID=UPI0035A8301F